MNDENNEFSKKKKDAKFQRFLNRILKFDCIITSQKSLYPIDNLNEIFHFHLLKVYLLLMCIGITMLVPKTVVNK